MEFFYLVSLVEAAVPPGFPLIVRDPHGVHQTIRFDLIDTFYPSISTYRAGFGHLPVVYYLQFDTGSIVVFT